MTPSFSTYLSTWGEEFLSRANRVRNLIGDAHWLSDGGHKEALLTEFLGRHLPSHLQLGRGFVRPRDEERSCSPEIDVLIARFDLHPPLFNESQLLIVPPGSVFGHLQSKSELTAGSLRAAIANIAAIQHVTDAYRESKGIWRGAVFASCPETRTAESILQTLRDILGDQQKLFDDIPDAVRDRPKRLEPHLLPKCIATYDRFVILISEQDTTTVRIRVFDTASLGFACLMCDLFAYSVANHGGDEAQELLHIIERAVQTDPACADVSL